MSGDTVNKIIVPAQICAGSMKLHVVTFRHHLCARNRKDGVAQERGDADEVIGRQFWVFYYA